MDYKVCTFNPNMDKNSEVPSFKHKMFSKDERLLIILDAVHFKNDDTCFTMLYLFLTGFRISNILLGYAGFKHRRDKRKG